MSYVYVYRLWGVVVYSNFETFVFTASKNAWLELYAQGRPDQFNHELQPIVVSNANIKLFIS